MIDPPKIVQTEAQPAAIIHITVPRNEIQQVMGPGIGELMQVLGAQHIAPAGAVFAHHLRMDPTMFDFELGVPVASAVTPAGRVKPGELPAARVARTIYHGAYEGLGSAWGEFSAWIIAQGVATMPDLWECYLTGPESGSDPAGWRTELNKRLAEG